jgi:RNA polymerase sigma-70 factor (ECF subfamily)
MASARVPDASGDHSPTDDELVVEALANPAAFDRIYERYHEDIHHFVLSRMADPDRAEDVTSQVFLKALRGLPFYRAGSFRGWLYRIARNAITDSYRRQPPVANGEVAAGRPAPEPEPLTVIEAREAREELQWVIGRLSGTQQAIIRLRLDGYTGQEMADRLGMSLSAMKSAQFRAFEKIRALMADSRERTIGPADRARDRSR